jgi:hypothetical protein
MTNLPGQRRQTAARLLVQGLTTNWCEIEDFESYGIDPASSVSGFLIGVTGLHDELLLWAEAELQKYEGAQVS